MSSEPYFSFMYIQGENKSNNMYKHDRNEGHTELLCVLEPWESSPKPIVLF
jgi:hypothetical protein